MAERHLIWPSQLDHVHLTSDDPARMVAWYEDAMGLNAENLGNTTWWLKGAERNLVISRGRKGGTHPQSLGRCLDAELRSARVL